MHTWVDAFLDYLLAECNYSEKTIEVYSTSLAAFVQFVEEEDENKQWKDVTKEDVREWIVHMMDEKQLKASTVNKNISALRTFYRYLRRMDYVTVNPMDKVTAPKKERSLPSFVKEKEIDTLLDEMDNDRSYDGVRDRTLIMLLYETGVRLAEVLALRHSDVDMERCQLKVTGKRNKQRIIPFGPELKEQIQMLLELKRQEAGEQPFTTQLLSGSGGKPMSRSRASVTVKKLLTTVTTQQKRSPHVLRHSFATAMLNHDADLASIQKLLGHESLATTEIYTHVSFSQLRNEYRNAHPRSGSDNKKH